MPIGGFPGSPSLKAIGQVVAALHGFVAKVASGATARTSRAHSPTVRFASGSTSWHTRSSGTTGAGGGPATGGGGGAPHPAMSKSEIVVPRRTGRNGITP